MICCLFSHFAAGTPVADRRGAGRGLNRANRSNTSLYELLTETLMTATVTAKGQVTIPKPVRDLLGIGPGSRVEFRRAVDGGVVLVRADEKPPLSRFARLRGHAGKGLSTDEIMALTRGET
jgi:AbrB family looped-hinge helix DNA binding protein